MGYNVQRAFCILSADLLLLLGASETPSPLLRTLGMSRRKSFILSIHIPCTEGVKPVAVAVNKHLPDSEYGTVFRTPVMSYFRHLQCPILDTRNVLF